MRRYSPVTLTVIAEDTGPRLITQAELLANASDVDGPALTASTWRSAAGSGTLADITDGNWCYHPAANANAPRYGSPSRCSDDRGPGVDLGKPRHHAGQRCTVRAGDETVITNEDTGTSLPLAFDPNDSPPMRCWRSRLRRCRCRQPDRQWLVRDGGTFSVPTSRPASWCLTRRANANGYGYAFTFQVQRQWRHAWRRSRSEPALRSPSTSRRSTMHRRGRRSSPRGHRYVCLWLSIRTTARNALLAVKIATLPVPAADRRQLAVAVTAARCRHQGRQAGV